MQQTGEILELQPPLGGLNRAAGYQQKPPYFSEDMLNVRAFDTIEGRSRIGSRPGLAKAFQQHLSLGPNVIINGEFNAGTDWAAVGNWTFGPPVATASGATSNPLSQVVNPLVVGATYRVTYDYTRTAGSISAVCGTTAGKVKSAASGSISESIVCAGNTGFKFAAVGFTGTVDNVTAKMLGGASTDENPIRMAAVIRSLATPQSATFTDEFTAAMGAPNWTHGGWTLDGTVSNGLPDVSIGHAVAPGPPITVRSAVLTDPTPGVSTSTFREVSVQWLNINMQSHGDHVYLCMDLASASPNPNTGGIMAAFYFNSIVGFQHYYAVLYIAGVQKAIAFTDLTPVHPPTILLRLNIDAANVVRVYLGDRADPLITYAAPSYSSTGPRAGFALNSYLNIGPSTIDWFRLSYTQSTAISPPEAVVLSANGGIWREAPAGTLATDTVMNVPNLASDRRIHATVRLQNLYIADYGIRVEGSDGKTNVDDVRFTSSSAGDLTAYGITAYGDILEIISGTGVRVGVYTVVGVETGALQITPVPNTVPGVPSTVGDIRYRVLRSAKIFDASLNPPTFAAVEIGTIGVSQFPPGCRSITLWQDRLWWCKNALTPHGWWASAAGYPNNYDYGSNVSSYGVAAAVNGTQSEFAGLIGEPLVTIIPINDDLAVFACKTSFYYLTGNPRLYGVFLNITREIGIVDIGAWCRTAGGRLIVLTPDGLYEITTVEAKPLSRDLLPQELVGLTDDRYDVSLAYDVARRGVLIMASGKDASIPSVHYFYDLRTGAYLPENHDRAFDPTAVVSYQPSGIGMPSVLWGGRDGYVRRFEDNAQSDDGTNFTSYCFYGPIRLGAGEYGDGFLHELVCVLDVASGSVTLTIHVGHSAQAAKAAAARYTTIMTAGRNRNRYPRLRGGAAYVKIAGTPGSRWAMESLTVTREKVGRLAVV